MKWFLRWRQKSRYRGLAVMLRKHLGPALLEQVMDITSDRRDLLTIVAECTEENERALLEKLARKWGLQVAPRVIYTEAEHIPAEYPLEYMEQEGFIAIYRDAVFRGVICSDPSRVPEFFGDVEHFELFLAPWTEIADALHKSKQRVDELKAEEERSREEAKQQLALEIVNELVARAKSYGAGVLDIQMASRGLSYVFELPNGRVGSGTIHKAVSPALLLLLSNFARLPTSREYVVHADDCLTRYTISWTEQEQESVSTALEKEEAKMKKESIQQDSLLATQFSTSVLIIDDNNVFGSVVERFLLREGFSVHRRDSARDALQELRQSSILPRVILCDLHMPEMNGMQFVSEVQQIQLSERISIFMLSSDEEIENEIEAIQRGAVGFLRKTEDPRILCAHVRRAIGTDSSFSEAA